MAEAEAAYRTALDIEPNDPKAWNNFGLFLAGQRKPAEAEAAFRKAIARQRNFAEAWANLGNLLASLQRPAEAATAYRERSPTSPKTPGSG